MLPGATARQLLPHLAAAAAVAREPALGLCGRDLLTSICMRGAAGFATLARPTTAWTSRSGGGISVALGGFSRLGLRGAKSCGVPPWQKPASLVVSAGLASDLRRSVLIRILAYTWHTVGSCSRVERLLDETARRRWRQVRAVAGQYRSENGKSKRFPSK